MAPQRSSRVPTALGSCGRSTSSLGRSPGASEATRGVHGNTTWRWEASAGVRENSPPLTSASEEGKTSYGKSPKKSSSLRMLRHRGSVQQKRRRRRRASGRQQVGSFYLETIRYNRCLFISTMGRVHYAGGGGEPAAARTPRYHKTLCITAAHNTRGGGGAKVSTDRGDTWGGTHRLRSGDARPSWTREARRPRAKHTASSSLSRRGL